MSKEIQRLFFASLVLALTGSASSDSLTYQQEFTKELVEFANLNRLQIGRLHRDVHAEVKSSSVPVVDRYFRYAIGLYAVGRAAHTKIRAAMISGVILAGILVTALDTRIPNDARSERTT